MHSACLFVVTDITMQREKHTITPSSLDIMMLCPTPALVNGAQINGSATKLSASTGGLCPPSTSKCWWAQGSTIEGLCSNTLPTVS